MQVKEEYSLERAILKHSTLADIVHRWFRQHSDEVGRDFKISMKKVRELQGEFQQKCIQYAFLRKLPWVVSDLSQDKMITLNNSLKRSYQKLIISSYFNTENTFQFFIFYLVKLVSLFLQQNFAQIQIDTTLESEFFIILYYTFLGIEMKEKTYEVIQRKYLKSIDQNRINEKLQRATRISFIEMLTKSNKIGSNNKLQKSQHSIHYSQHSICKPLRESFFKENTSDINYLLRDSLYVNPLPPIKPKKVKIRELEKLQTLPDLFQTDTTEDNKKEKKSNHPKKMHVYSNQLSNSLKSMHPQQFFFQLASKKIKINRSFYECPVKQNNDPLRELNERKEKLHNSLHKKQNDHLKTQPKKSSEWLGIVGNLKKKVFGIRSHGFENEKYTNTNHLDQDEDESPMEEGSTEAYANSCQITPNMKQIEQDHIVKEKYSSELPKSNVQTLDCTFLRQKINGAKKQITVETYDQKSEQFNSLFQRTQKQAHNNRKITSNSIRQDKKSFVNCCKARKNSILELQRYNLHENWILHQYKN